MATNPNIAMSYRPNVALQRRDPLADAANIQSLQANQTKMDDLREFKELSTKLAAAGKNPDPLAMVSEMRASGRPDMIAKSYELETNIKALGLEEKAYKALIGGAAPAGPSMMQTPQAASPTNALGSGTFGMGQANAPAPVNALAPAPAMAPQTQEINRLRQVAMQYPNTKIGAQAMEQAKLLQQMQPKPPASVQELNAYLAMPPEQRAAFERLQKIKTPSTTISTGNQKFEDEFSKLGGKVTFERLDNEVAAMEKLPTEVAKIDETLNVLRNSDVNTGLGAEVFTVLDKARGQFAADKAAGKRVTNTEYLDALLGSEVFPQISALGIGARGMDTPAEREFLRKVIAGTINLNKETLIKMAELRRKGAELRSDKYNERVGKGEFNRYFNTVGREPVRVDLPPAPSAAGAAPKTPAPTGVDAALWNVMTPEERKLWPK